MSLPQFKLLRPRTVGEAIEQFAKHASGIRVLAGGTDLIPSMRQKLFEPQFVLDIRHIALVLAIGRGSEFDVAVGSPTAGQVCSRYL